MPLPSRRPGEHKPSRHVPVKPLHELLRASQPRYPRPRRGFILPDGKDPPVPSRERRSSRPRPRAALAARFRRDTVLPVGNRDRTCRAAGRPGRSRSHPRSGGSCSASSGPRSRRVTVTSRGVRRSRGLWRSGRESLPQAIDSVDASSRRSSSGSGPTAYGSGPIQEGAPTRTTHPQRVPCTITS